MVMLRTKNRFAGFTVVELVIAIAIMGIISASIFFANRQLALNKPNNALKADAARLLTAARQWVAANNGVLPTSQADWSTNPGNVMTYVTGSGATFHYPGNTAQPYNAAYRTTTAPTYITSGAGQNYATMFVGAPATCANNVLSFPATPGSRQIAVEVFQDGGGGTPRSYCISQ